MALARALAIEPRVLLLDEPFGALDAKVRKDLRAWLRELHDRTGHTTVFVTHDQEEALELADRVAILNEGKLEQVGTPDAIYDHPASAFVCGFLGETNRIPVTVAGGQALFEGAPVFRPSSTNASGRADLFVRPHQLRIEADAGLPLAGEVEAVRRTGALKRIEVVVRGLARKLDVDVGGALTPSKGDRISLRVTGGHVFAAA
jgi:sulfate/thiosulfate transport system ATP-binding protein